MRKLSVVLWVKKHEPGLLSIAERTPKSLVPLLGGVRIIDLYLGPLYHLGLKGVTVVMDEEMAQAKEYVLHKYSTGRIRVLCETDAAAALSGFLKQRRNGPLFLIPVSDVLFADWARLVSVLSDRSEGNYEIITKRKELVGVFIASRETLTESFGFRVERGGMDDVWDKFVTVLMTKNRPVVVEGAFFGVRTVYDYYRMQMEMRRNLEKYAEALFSVPGEDVEEEDAAQVLGPGFVKNSHISSSCIVEGYVAGSVLFPHVRVGKDAKVIDSIVMSNNYVGEGAIVQNAVLCENSALPKVTPNIGEGSRIGEDDQSGANGRYPQFIRGGITLVGRSVEIPKGIRIARNCYIPSETDRALFKGKDRIKAGDTLEAVHKAALSE
jgi:ADP-glucose pyrophosphorylase